jgi:hypothetical protein
MIKCGWDTWSGQPITIPLKPMSFYGDKILIGVIPTAYDEKASEEEQRAAARDYSK